MPLVFLKTFIERNNIKLMEGDFMDPIKEKINQILDETKKN